MEILPLEYEFICAEDVVICPTLLKYNDEIILINTGYMGSLDVLEKILNNNGVGFLDITKIIITHYDCDTVGLLNSIIIENPKVQIFSSKFESQFIEGTKITSKLLKVREIKKNLINKKNISKIELEQLKELFNDYESSLKKIKPIKVHGFLENNEKLLDSNLEVIFTPGSTKGHISLYLNKSKTLIVGNVIGICEDNYLDIVNPYYIDDLEENKKSLKKLLGYNIKRIICFSGGVYIDTEKDIKKSIKKASERNLSEEDLSKYNV